MSIKKTFRRHKKAFVKHNSPITRKRKAPSAFKRFDRKFGKVAKKIDKGRRSFAKSNTYKFANNFSQGVSEVLGGDQYL